MIRSEQPIVGASAALIKSDAELARRCRAGDSAAWEQVVHEYSRRVFNLAYRFTGRHESAEDLTQEVFVRVYRSLDQYDAQAGDLANWLMRLARNLVIDDYRRRCGTPAASGDQVGDQDYSREAATAAPDRVADGFEAAKRVNAPIPKP